VKKLFQFAFSVFVLVTSPALFAQNTVFLHVKVPFDFVLSGQKMPAGDYSIEETTNSGALTFKCLDTQKAAIVLGEPEAITPEAAPGLKFEKRNGEEHLVRVITGNGPARVLPIR